MSRDTTQEIEAEWQYLYDEALGLGRNEARARKEADEWKAQFTNENNKRTTEKR